MSARGSRYEPTTELIPIFLATYPSNCKIKQDSELQCFDRYASVLVTGHEHNIKSRTHTQSVAPDTASPINAGRYISCMIILHSTSYTLSMTHGPCKANWNLTKCTTMKRKPNTRPITMINKILLIQHLNAFFSFNLMFISKCAPYASPNQHFNLGLALQIKHDTITKRAIFSKHEPL